MSVFSHFVVDGVDYPQNNLQLQMDKDKTAEVYYRPEVVYVSYMIENPKATPQTIKIVSSKDMVVPANGTVTVTLQSGDKIVLPA